ncbi:conserved exported hypothetical protein [Sphingomonas sp. EC-HK361]|uniref:hypothetical protein n=1 Tax=Sphingomonas sp. EC-HK361 TaxID=2038397 RepID=UPI0012537495|nr:hypothetical protein [Sphingomonas sp. EC-HK361]VVT22370.1 conserved exported hypothetical protein [Sphingomonas sp. EC-HK361]
MKPLARAVLAATLALAATDASAQASAARLATGCRLRIDSNGSNWMIQGYDPFASNQSTATFDVMFFNEGDGECRFRPVFMTDGTPFGLQADTGRRVGYTLLDTWGSYDATPLGGRTIARITNRPVVVSPGAQQLVRYVLNVAAGEIPGDGIYSQRLIMEADQTDGTPIASRQFLVGIQVIPSATMRLAGAFRRNGGQADVDLGELQQGVAPVPLALQVQSTRGYRLGLRSQNGGKLRLAGTDWWVPYDVQIDGRTATLTGDSSLSFGRGGGLRADTLPVVFRVGDVDGKRAGVYSDVLTVSVAVE